MCRPRGLAGSPSAWPTEGVRELSRRREPVYVLGVGGVVVPLLSLWFRWTIEGSENVPRRGPAILACNHISYLDPLAMGYAVHRAGRRPRFLAKAELFEDRLLGWALRATGQIEVARGTARASQALDRAVAALGRGEVVLIFPEGTVTTDPELKPMPARSGTVRLALRSGAPLIPCAVWGTANIWPKGPYRSSWRPRQDVLVRIGAPMEVAGDPDSPHDWRMTGERITAEIGRLVASLKPVIPDRRRPLEKSA
jgi:1-acyl-sn-glycerol-3-phosphate acyltransferase